MVCWNKWRVWKNIMLQAHHASFNTRAFRPSSPNLLSTRQTCIMVLLTRRASAKAFAELARRKWRGQQTRGSCIMHRPLAVPNVWHKDAQRTSQDCRHEPNMTHVRSSCHHPAHSLLNTFFGDLLPPCVSAVHPKLTHCNTFLLSRHWAISFPIRKMDRVPEGVVISKMLKLWS